MKPGDIVVILDNKYFYKYFNVGDKAKLIKEINGGCWWADFTINKNYYEDGKWLILRENFNFKLFEKKQNDTQRNFRSTFERKNIDWKR